MGPFLAQHMLQILLFFVVLIAIEFILQFTWNLFYFKYGFSIFKFNVQISKNFTFPIEDLNQMFSVKSSLPFFPSIAFRALDPSRCAFRETRWWPSLYVPIMHGLITFIPEPNILKFHYFLNITPALILVFSIIYSAFLNGDGTIDYFFIIYFGSSFFFQAIRFLFLTIDCRNYFKQLGVTQKSKNHL